MVGKLVTLGFGLALSFAGCVVLYTASVTAPALPMDQAWDAAQWIAAYGLVSGCALMLVGCIVFSLPAWTR